MKVGWGNVVFGLGKIMGKSMMKLIKIIFKKGDIKRVLNKLVTVICIYLYTGTTNEHWKIQTVISYLLNKSGSWCLGDSYLA